jgi:hypothetical protein
MEDPEGEGGVVVPPPRLCGGSMCVNRAAHSVEFSFWFRFKHHIRSVRAFIACPV